MLKSDFHDTHYRSNERYDVYNGAVYVIRDVWRDRSQSALMGCEYATTQNGRWGIHLFDWHPCGQGVHYSTIEPAFTLDELKTMDELNRAPETAPEAA